MALLNEVLVGRFNRFAQKLLSMKGPAALPQLRAEMGLNFTVQRGAEDRYLEGWDLYGVTGAAAAIAATFGVASIRNPVGSNVIGVVTLFSAFEPTPGSMSLTLFRPGSAGAIVDQTTLRPAQGWDGRGRPSSTLIVSDSTGGKLGQVGGVLINNPAIGTANTSNPGIPYGYGYEVPLSPGSALAYSAGSVNEILTYSVWWRERFLEDSERA